MIKIGLSKDYNERFTNVEAFAHALELACQPDKQPTAPLKTEQQPVLLHPQTLPIVSPPSEYGATHSLHKCDINPCRIPKVVS